MRFSLHSERLGSHRTGCIVVGVYAGRSLSPSALELDAASGHALSRVLAGGDLDAEPGTTLLLHQPDRLACERVLLVGLGCEGELREGRYRAVLASAVQALGTTGAADTSFCLHELPVNGRDEAWKIEQAVLAVMQGGYRFDRCKSKPVSGTRALQQVAFRVGDRPAATSAAEAAIARGVAIGEAMALAKDLANLPGNVCTPAYLGEQALELASRLGLRVEILAQPQIEQLGMGAFLAVARGSSQPPRLILLEHRGGAADAPPVVLVGKGITFDAGGLSLKQPAEMEEMKFDMCGAASVFGALHAAARMKLPLNVVGIVPATENMPDGNAIKPGDVVTTLSGQTVEIVDTDSEGRVVLCDALTLAQRYRPAAVIDIATLTGEIVAALGEVATGLFSNSDALARELLAAGEGAWDRAWQMPLWDDYQEALKSSIADLPNIGSRSDCAVVAAAFLSRFAGGYPWAHLDIAGTAAGSGAHRGATGRPVALLVHFLAGRARETQEFP